VSSHPVELLLGRAADAHGPTDRSWGLYAGLAALAGAVGPAGAGHPDAALASLLGDGGGAIVATNHAGSPLRVLVQLPDDAAAARLVGPAGTEPATPEGGAVEVALSRTVPPSSLAARLRRPFPAGDEAGTARQAPVGRGRVRAGCVGAAGRPASLDRPRAGP
jgi:hypothetical protein